MQRLVAEPDGTTEEVVRGAAATPVAGDCRIIRGWLPRRRYECGHHDAVRFHFVILGRIIRFYGWFRRSSGLCPECFLRQMRPQIIRCADCGEPILPGEQVATPCRDYRDTDDARLSIIRREEGGELVVTCLCADNFLGFSGHWDGERIRRLRWTTGPDE